MSDTSQGPGWWQASDGKWYPPETAPAGYEPPQTSEPTIQQPVTPPEQYPPTIAQPATPVPGSPGGPPPASTQTKSRTPMWIAIGGVALLVVAGIVAAIAMSGDDDDDETATSTTTTIAAVVTTEGVTPTTEAATPTTEAATPTTEGVTPTTEAVTTTTEATPPPPGGDGSSPGSPAPLGTALPVGEWTAAIVAFTPDATPQVVDNGNDPPGPGMVYSLVRISATNNSTESAKLFFELTAGLVGPDGVEHTDISCSALVPDDLALLDEAAPGETIEGNFCLVVPADQLAGAAIYLGETFDSSVRNWYPGG